MQLNTVHECVSYQAKFTQHAYESNELPLSQISSPRCKRRGRNRKPSRSQALQSIRFSHFNEVQKCTMQRLQEPRDEENITTTYTYTCQTLTANSQRLLSCCMNLYTETVVQLAAELQMGRGFHFALASPPISKVSESSLPESPCSLPCNSPAGVDFLLPASSRLYVPLWGDR